MSVQLIEPHGGTLVNRVDPAAAQTKANATITLSDRQQCDLEMIAIGAMSPLTGFMGQADYDSVCDAMKLSDGTVWPIPITCAVDTATADGIQVGDSVQLNDDKGRLLGFLKVEEKYPHDKKKQALSVFKTDEDAHPGVKVLKSEGDVCLGGPIQVVTPRHNVEFPEQNLTPAQTRAEFAKRGWHTVVAFQTRNPIHRAHEYLTKCAQEICDGLLVHPLVGQTQAGDIPADVRMRCYQVLLEKYYHPDHTMLSVLPAAMRYAGPREAILHAILRQNYGCSHFIVGRDHAGVGSYYGTYDAQEIFRRAARRAQDCPAQVRARGLVEAGRRNGLGQDVSQDRR
jgi:sulfate adenylyltransferase